MLHDLKQAALARQDWKQASSPRGHQQSLPVPGTGPSLFQVVSGIFEVQQGHRPLTVTAHRLGRVHSKGSHVTDSHEQPGKLKVL